MPDSQAVRYSTANVAKSESAQAFAWEAPVPVNAFWDSLTYCLSRNFISNFSEDEFRHLPIDPESKLTNNEKIELMLRLLKEKINREEAAASPNALEENDYAQWKRLWQAICTMQIELNAPEAEQTLRMMVDKRQSEKDIVPAHMLADYLVKVGKYEEAEVIERPVCEAMDAHERLGKNSPQAINARRIIARAMWLQGGIKRVDAKALIKEIDALIEGMKGGQFEVYREEERDLNAKMMEELEEAD